MPANAPPTTPNRLQAIYTATAAGAAMEQQDAVIATAGKGLESDRYALQTGTFSQRKAIGRGGRQVSIISLEAVALCNERLGTDFHGGEFRRNLIVSGLAIVDGRQAKLIGQRFQLGDAILRIASSCPPCGYLSRLLGHDMRSGLHGIGGYRAEIEQSGTLSIGQSLKII